MKIKSALPLLLTLTLFVDTAFCQQLPGVSVLSNPRLEKINNRGYISYYSNSWHENATVLAALVRGAGTPGTLPSCDSTLNRPKTIQAKAQLRAAIYKGIDGDVVWKSCTTQMMLWPPTGDQLLITTYPGNLLVWCPNCASPWLYLNIPLSVSPQPWGVEMTVW